MTDDDVGRCLLKFPLVPRDTYYSPRRYYYRPTISYIIRVGSIRSLTTVLPKKPHLLRLYFCPLREQRYSMIDQWTMQ